MSAEHEQHGIAGSILTSVLTGVFASIPEHALTFMWKALSVFMLAAAAELGRRAVNHIWRKGKS